MAIIHIKDWFLEKCIINLGSKVFDLVKYLLNKLY